MNLDTLRNLPQDDQRVFLLGRVAAETTETDAALRFLWAALQERRNVGASLEAPDYFSTTVKECRKFVRDSTTISADDATAIRGALRVASELYTRRNRYVHDLLRESLLSSEWELVRLTGEVDIEPEPELVSFDSTVELVRDFVAVKFRLRGCAMHLLTGTWEGLAFGQLEGRWDGSVDISR
ncbi:hypothetical protein [Schumannella soli]|uniref:Uncharacterized protein n=1 Tax=Schumannella soli TaxID=2590779 RepID=A0A506Y994_9MICO|nr:hypothetical protein [Schumannella soli]TPW78060.1 hypothetical protein FJ657_05385 [Schumannella soli]